MQWHAPGERRREAKNGEAPARIALCAATLMKENHLKHSNRVKVLDNLESSHTSPPEQTILQSSPPTSAGPHTSPGKLGTRNNICNIYSHSFSSLNAFQNPQWHSVKSSPKFFSDLHTTHGTLLFLLCSQLSPSSLSFRLGAIQFRVPHQINRPEQKGCSK